MVRRALGFGDDGVKWKLKLVATIEGMHWNCKQAAVQVNISCRYLLHKIKQTGLEER
jgi:hypothetical protein